MRLQRARPHPDPAVGCAAASLQCLASAVPILAHAGRLSTEKRGCEKAGISTALITCGVLGFIRQATSLHSCLSHCSRPGSCTIAAIGHRRITFSVDVAYESETTDGASSASDGDKLRDRSCDSRDGLRQSTREHDGSSQLNLEPSSSRQPARHGASLLRPHLVLRELSELLPQLADPQDQQPQLQDPAPAGRGASGHCSPQTQPQKLTLKPPTNRAASRTSTSSRTRPRRSSSRSRRSAARSGPSRSRRP